MSTDNKEQLQATILRGFLLSRTFADGKPRIRDVELGERLGYARTDHIRKLIAELISSKRLNDYEVIHLRRETSERGGRPATEFWLTREQALLVIIRSDQPAAAAITAEIIAVFEAYLDGRLANPHDQSLALFLKHHRDRFDLNRDRIPAGYFGVFSESSYLTLDLIDRDLPVDQHTIPDISIGMAWSKYWEANNLDAKYGKRCKYSHHYPSDYPQSMANSQILAWACPLAALGEFRIWIPGDYLLYHLPKYMRGKAKDGAITRDTADKIVAALAPKRGPAKIHDGAHRQSLGGASYARRYQRTGTNRG